MRKELVGQGKEHKVYLIQPNNSQQLENNTVIKLPNFYMQVYLKLGLTKPLDIRDGFEEAKKIIGNSDIKIPQTKVKIMRKAYAIRQEFIDSDQSLTADKIKEILKQYPYVYTRYLSNPSNFRVYNENIYWLDPLRGPLSRILDKTGLLSYQDYYKLRLNIKKVLRRLKH